MSLQIINKAILAMCGEIQVQSTIKTDWNHLTEECLLYEVVVCIAGSQMLYEMAVGIAEHLRGCDLLNPSKQFLDNDYIKERIVQQLSRPILIQFSDGSSRLRYPRFKHRLASLITATFSQIYGEGLTIKGILESTKSSRAARKLLVSVVCGFGPKQASLFLRRIGYSAELAVLDVHVLNYLEMATGVNIKASTLGKLSVYEQIEDKVRDIAVQFGHCLGCVDLAMWVTMRVAKQEAYL